ncbi:Tellurite resistance protein TehB homolog [uncultured Clostridium sp.]|uniref:class I SAM-dependent methyltransferase n=1 Tax=uncultured Clostridium sp. TaxID=59620 RepID=UPI000821ED1F|nr:class I SAM-dependent methyltransferase [uncultured Clostridium sp.]SCJ99772.1 Tellurite resistance protein TehB homolog [uncultured Clostridium sp.]
MNYKTLNYYNTNAKEYFETTKNIKTTDIYNEFINMVKPSGKVLDLGCGSGRDSLYFKNAGYYVTSIDGSIELAKEAKKLIKQEVIVSKFEDFRSNEKFDGIWACASLLHVRRENIEGVLRNLTNNLNKGSVFYLSFKYGDNEYIDDKGRYFNCYIEETFMELITKIKEYKLKAIYKTGDFLGRRDNLIWLNIILERI